MYSAGLAEATAASSGSGAATSAARPSFPPHAANHPQHRPRREDSYYYHQGHGGGGGGEGAPGWEQGDRRGAEGGWGSEDGHNDDGALLVRWSEGLDFDRKVPPSVAGCRCSRCRCRFCGGLLCLKVMYG